MLRILDSDYMDMSLGFAYRFLDNSTVLTEMHDHNYYEYFIITSGSILHTVNGRETEQKSGEMVFIRPNDFHCYQLESGQNCNIINISFRTVFFEKLIAYFGQDALSPLINAGDPPVVMLTPSKLSVLKKSHAILNVCHSKESLTVQLKTLLIDVFSYFILHFEEQAGTGTEKWLQEVLEQMNTPDNIAEGLPALLHLSGFSHGHLCRIMKQQYGMTPIQYVTDLRLQYAANLLASTDYDILTISISVGFSSLSHFITVFKKKYATSPSRYRAEHNNIYTWK